MPKTSPPISTSRLRPPRIGAQILGGDQPLRVLALSLAQPKAPLYFDVTSSDGREVVVHWVGDVWLLVISPTGSASPKTEADGKETQLASPALTGKMRAMASLRAHATLNSAREEYKKRSEGGNGDRIQESFEVYTQAIVGVNEVDPAFYEGRRP
jgi:hypothetical protein